jgi:flagellar M-ring protein FliF
VDGTKQVLEKLGGRMSHFSFNQKVLLVAIVAAAGLSVVIFSFWLRHEDKAVLFTNLSAEDASRAIEELAKQNVDADLSNGGTTVLVPRSQVHRLRVDLAAKGVPSSGVVGFEIFDGKQYGLTEFLQDVNFKRALEGELTKSIESLAGITSARVHLVIPKPSIFKKMQAPATASVVVGMAATARLGEEQIHGIQALVSGSVEGLAIDNVTIIDQHGTVLSRHYEPDGVGRSEGQLAMKKEVDVYLSQKAESMLAQVLGDDKAIVRVDATLNFERLEKNRETYDPASTVVRSEERNESSQPQANGTSESSVTNYEINKTVENIVGEVGGIKSLSVAVFVDGTYAAPAGGGEPAYTPLTDEQRTQLQRIVATAVGLNPARGDQIEVVNMQFHGRDEAAPAPKPGLMAEPWLQRAPELIGKVLIFGVAAVMLLLFKRNLGRLMSSEPSRRRAAAAAGGGAADIPMPSIRGEGGDASSERMISEVKDYASENPEQIAELIHSWVTEPE